MAGVQGLSIRTSDSFECVLLSSGHGGLCGRGLHRERSSLYMGAKVLSDKANHLKRQVSLCSKALRRILRKLNVVKLDLTLSVQSKCFSWSLHLLNLALYAHPVLFSAHWILQVHTTIRWALRGVASPPLFFGPWNDNIPLPSLCPWHAAYCTLD